MLLKELKINNNISGFFYLDRTDSYLKTDSNAKIDTYLADEAIDFFKSLSTNPELNVTVVNQLSDINIFDSVLTMSFNGDPNIFIYKDDTYKFKDSDKKYLTTLLSSNIGNNICVFFTSQLTKEMKSKMTMIDITKPKYPQNKQFYINFIREKSGGRIEYDATIKLIEKTQANLNKICIEIKKLLSFKSTGQNITKFDVESIISDDYEDTIFTFSNALSIGNFDLALSELAKIRKLDNKSSKILNALTSQFQKIFFVKIMLSKKTDDEIMKILDIKSEYRLKRIKEDTKFSPIEMKKILAILHKYEIECRTGNINENYALDCALSEIIAMKR